MNGEKKLFHHQVIHHTKRVAHHVKRHTKRFLIPHEGNGYHPHALRPRALRLYSVSLVIVKVFVTGFLFLLYPSQAEFATYSANQVFALTNESRAEAKVVTLKRNAKLDAAANLKAQDMFADGYFAHTAPDGTKPWAFLDRSGYKYVAAGENLAIDFTDADAMHAAFLASPSHRANILNSRYEEMGIAVVEGTMDGAKTILVVEFFATPYAVKTAKTPTTTTTQPKTTTAPKLSDYRASDGRSDPSSITAQTNERVNVSVSFRNSGRAAWLQSGSNATVLQIGTGPKVYDESWISQSIVSRLKQSTVRPGERGTFNFVVKTPSINGAIEKEFSVTATALGRIAGGSIVLPMTVKEKPQLVETRTEIAGVETTELPPGPPPEEVIPPATETTPTPATTETPTLNERTETAALATAVDTGETQQSFAKNLLDSSKGFFLAVLTFLIVALMLNILIEIRIQHPHVILQTVLVIVLTGLAFAVRFHFLEQVGQSMRIL